MTRLPPLLAVLLLALLPFATVRAEDAPVPAVDRAIEQGVAWLLEEQRPDGTWGGRSRAVGHTALAVFALLHAGLDDDANDDAPGKPGTRRQKALRWLDRHGPGLDRAGDRAAETYDTSLLVLVERARGRAQLPRMQRLVALLEAAQAANGQWSYHAGAGRPAPAAGDNSNAQFAVLALGAAVGEGVRVDPRVLARARAWWRRAARPDGAWGYASGGAVASQGTGSMTAAGIAALAILDAALAGRNPDVGAENIPTDVLVARATERLSKGFRVDHNFGPAQGGAAQRQRKAGRGWLHYYLWSIERAMVLAGVEHIGAHDWYAEGRDRLLATQRKDGSWRGEHPLYATCFALLFLTRAADPPRVFTPPDRAHGPVTGRKEADPTPAAPEPSLPGDVADWLAREQVTPGALRGSCLARGPACLDPLAHALSSPDRRVRQRANETLRALLGDERVGRADRHPLARGRLRVWIRANTRHLRVEGEGFVLR